MRVTVRLDDELWKQAKSVAVDTGRTLSSVVGDALRMSLARQAANQRKRVKLTISDGAGGLMPGVDINNSASLLDLMDEGLDIEKLR
jgi:predicted transcriptional regulator